MKKTVIKMMSALLCLTLIFTLSFTVANASSATDETKLNNLGDINNDRRINASDARIALRASAKLEKLDAIQTFAADVNRDGKVTAADARQLLRVCAKLDVLRVNAELKLGQEYTVDSLYDAGAYLWICTVSPETGLDVEKAVEVLSFGTPEGTTPEQTYTFTAKAVGTYEIAFKLVHVGDGEVLNEMIYIFTVK